MARVKQRGRKSVNKKIESPFKNYWTKQNYTILYVGIGILIIGYFLMAQGPWENPVSQTISPLVLLIAYLIVFPLAIFYNKGFFNKREKKNDVSGQS